MSLNNEGRHFYDQENDGLDEPLRRSKTPSFTDEPEEEKLRRHRAADEKSNSFLERFRHPQRSQKIVANDNEVLSRSEQKRRDQDEENERKAQLLGKRLNKVIWILIGLIIITYLIMRFVNF